MEVKIYTQLLLLCLIKLLLWAGAAAALDECRRECGNVTFPYPFGIRHPNCFKKQEFKQTCNDSATPSVLYYGNVPILNISVQEATATVKIFTAYDCYFQSGYTSQSMSMFDFTDCPFRFSATRNKFTATGCDTSAMMVGSKGEPYGSGCMSLCNSPVDMTAEGSCSGIGCCQTQLPKGFQLLNISLSSFSNHSNTLDFNPCGYAFLADQSWFNFSTFNLSVCPEEFENSQVVLDWVVENKKCESAQSSRNPSSYACGPNSDCLDSDNRYRCKCKEGYKGNPYLNLTEGCQDIDECSEPAAYPCEGTCQNTPGNYTCRCPLGMQGDGKQDCRGLRLPVLATGNLLILVLIKSRSIECY